ncbi:polysaccharide pyruvyl transferase family protein [Mailhella sp.]|uniref:polysaccharide pyruvyl transferase family protein n=1 Tax=Mailhella sp. TaxID=1981029 RepID=UPI004062C5BA
MPKLTASCTGCSACVHACPVSAIHMQMDGEGFLSPVIDEAHCIDCGHCVQICPVAHPAFENDPSPRCFAAMASDELRLESSSGAVFPVLAEAVLEQGGAVCGAAFLDDWSVGHIIVEDRLGLERLKGSKYVQSDMGECFPQVKALLEAGRLVLFSGTPCQVAGLRAFLRKEYERLQTVDIICHGTPSPGVWNGWLKENFNTAEIESIRFRDKRTLSWKDSARLSIERHGQEIGWENYNTGDFYPAFGTNLILRRSCGECRFNCLPRQGDLTIGDFWGIEKIKKSMNDGKGTSIVLVNNARGQNMLDTVTKAFKAMEAVPLKGGFKKNPNIVGSSTPSKSRERFFELYASKGASAALRFFSHDESDCKIVNYWFAVNYGANLTCWALQETLFSLGYSAKVINYMTESWRMKRQNTFAEEFAQKHLSLTKQLSSFEELGELNQTTRTFLVGSDQVFRSSIYKTHGDSVYTLSFVEPNKKRVACAASFGSKKFEGSALETERFRYDLDFFSAISVREQAGVEIFRKMGIEAEQILDPVFLLKKDRWDNLADGHKEKNKGGILYFSLAKKRHFQMPKFFGDLEKTLGIPANIQKFNVNRSIEDWLDGFRKADFVVTDSFHATCFALIFHKPFIALTRNIEARSRIDYLLGLLGLQDRIYAQDDTKLKELKPIDWEAVDAVLAAEKDRALNWLREALEAPVPAVNDERREANFVYRMTLAKEDNAKRAIALLANKWKIYYRYVLYAIKANVGAHGSRKKYKEKYKYYKGLQRKLRELGKM